MNNDLLATYFAQHREDAPSLPLCLTADSPNSTVALNAVGSPASISLEYSTDTLSWHTYTIGTAITLARRGDRIFLKGGNSTFSSSASNYYKFAMTGRIKASGNLMSLIDPTCESKTIPNQDYFFYALFSGCTSLLTAPMLPATTLRNRCYAYLFNNCMSLAAAPALPATSLKSYCYQRLFYGCTSLVAAPELPATSTSYAGVYYQMFCGCTSLTRSPVIRMAADTSNAENGMFLNCTSLARVEVTFNAWGSGSSGHSDWLSGVASEGVFICPAALDTTTRSASRVPVGWTVQTK